uniref:Uncharacterized protein n=1 Tax=Plectus sambesii TaxID=2011161 RepID=A0A914WVF0_9BILA
MFSRAFHRKFVPLTEEDEIFGSYNDTNDHHPDSEADIVSISSADVGIMPYRQSNDYDTYLKRTESVASFSSIASARVRQQFAQALTNLHQSLFGMDSPVSEDRSPNQPHPPTSIGGDPFNSFGAAHHGAFDNGNVDGDHHHQDHHHQQHEHDLHHEQQRPHATSVGMASSHGSSHESEDSNNGFVKLDHPTDLLADYGFPSDAHAHAGPHPPAPTFHRDEQSDFAHLHHDRPEITPSDEVGG